ncbi:DNA-3-methyladenine glycosylase [archaeon]|nr:DNA-3-methyladenine glycosylase [archaeon]
MALSRSFYERDTIEVAKNLLGKTIIKKTSQGTMTGLITEVEAYKENDEASHSCNGKTKRSEIMFGKPGHAYVYLCYGFYWMLNFVTEKEGTAGAVLIREIKPLDGIKLMQKNRGQNSLQGLTDGPGKLCVALNINKKENGIPITQGNLYVKDGIEPKRIHKSSRIGISKATEKQWRFYCTNQDF